MLYFLKWFNLPAKCSFRVMHDYFECSILNSFLISELIAKYFPLILFMAIFSDNDSAYVVKGDN